MKLWWNSRAPRERLILALAAVVMTGMLYFLLIWEPLVKGNEQLILRQQDAQSLQAWLYQVEPELSALRSQTGTARPGTQGSLLSIADRSAKASGLKDAVNRMQPDGDNAVRIWLEAAPFNPLLAWLHKLQQQQGVQVSDLNISRESKPGLVKVRLTLKR